MPGVAHMWQTEGSGINTHIVYVFGKESVKIAGWLLSCEYLRLLGVRSFESRGTLNPQPGRE